MMVGNTKITSILGSGSLNFCIILVGIPKIMNSNEAKYKLDRNSSSFDFRDRPTVMLDCFNKKEQKYFVVLM